MIVPDIAISTLLLGIVVGAAIRWSRDRYPDIKVPPGTAPVWAVAYFALIVGFVPIYASLGPGNFSQATSRDEERAFEATQQEVVDIVGQSLIRAVGSEPMEPIPNVRIPTSGLTVSELSAERRRLTMTFHGYVEDHRDGVTVYGPDAVEFELTIDTRSDGGFGTRRSFDRAIATQNGTALHFSPEIPDLGTGEVLFDDQLLPLSDQHPELAAVVDFAASRLRRSDTDVVVEEFTSSLVLDDSQYRRLVDIHRLTHLGDPLVAPDSISRMLYYSSTTLTTLGLGDISPISSAARTWTIVQTVLGITVVGLFVNSVGRASRQTVETQPQ